MSIQELKFYASAEQECGYLPNHQSVSLFADPDAQMNPTTYSVLIDHGFRRSGEHVYRPYCPNCHECIPVRVPLHDFVANRSQRRCQSRNSDLQIKVSDQLREEHFQLYRRYISQRHSGGSMDTNSELQFRSFISSSWCTTVFIEFYLGERLLAVAVTDVIHQGWSAFYTFFDPELSQARSLGRFAVLTQIELARASGYQFLYLGYWIAECAKMRYKSEYRPLEKFQLDCWQTF